MFLELLLVLRAQRVILVILQVLGVKLHVQSVPQGNTLYKALYLVQIVPQDTPLAQVPHLVHPVPLVSTLYQATHLVGIVPLVKPLSQLQAQTAV